MSKYHPIHKEISVESMRYMREEEHMNNREIAERLGISIATVRKYLGKMTPELRAEFKRAGGRTAAALRWAGVPSDQRVPGSTPQEEPDAVLRVTDRTMCLMGDKAKYTIYFTSGNVHCEIEEESRAFRLKIDELPAIIAELSAINRKCDTLKMTTEMW